jgi:hypothetical protein
VLLLGHNDRLGRFVIRNTGPRGEGRPHLQGSILQVEVCPLRLVLTDHRRPHGLVGALATLGRGPTPRATEPLLQLPPALGEELHVVTCPRELLSYPLVPALYRPLIAALPIDLDHHAGQ